MEQIQLTVTKDELSLIESSLNAYWHLQNNKLMSGTINKDLGIIEEINCKNALKDSKELMIKIDSGQNVTALDPSTFSSQISEATSKAQELISKSQKVLDDQKEFLSKLKKLIRLFFEQQEHALSSYCIYNISAERNVSESEGVDEIKISIVSGKPGMIIGLYGRTLDSLKEYIKRFFECKFVSVSINELNVFQ